MATERVLSNLNLISFKTESGLQNHIDELQDGDLVFTPDNSLKGTLLDFKWADHLLNDMSWLRADTFSWQSGDVYVAAYNHLVADFEGAELKRYYAWVADSGHIYYSDIENVTDGRVAYMYNNGKFTFDPYIYFNVSDGAVSVGVVSVTRDASKDKDGIVNSNDDTFGDTTITYYRAEDGHKICLPDQEDKILALYNATGVAWYYILDTANKQFKLPRTKYGFTGLRDEVGNYVPESLPNIRAESSGTGLFKGGGGSFTGAFVMRDGPNEGVYGSGGGTYFGVDFDASLSSSTYQDNAPVQERATQMYLYFYVGNFERDAVEQTAGIVAEMFNNKADSDLGNIPTNYDYVVESQLPTAENGYTWYRKYKSGWVEQGGSLLGTGGYVTTVFPVEFTNDKYTLVCINHQNSTVAWSNRFGFNKTATGFTWVADSGIPEDWQASGMSA